MLVSSDMLLWEIASGSNYILTSNTEIYDYAEAFYMITNFSVTIVLIFRFHLLDLCVDDRGLISHILCAKFGGYVTFGTLESRVVSASGQPTLKDLLYLYNLRQLW